MLRWEAAIRGHTWLSRIDLSLPPSVCTDRQTPGWHFTLQFSFLAQQLLLSFLSDIKERNQLRLQSRPSTPLTIVLLLEPKSELSLFDTMSCHCLCSSFGNLSKICRISCYFLPHLNLGECMATIYNLNPYFSPFCLHLHACYLLPSTSSRRQQSPVIIPCPLETNRMRRLGGDPVRSNWHRGRREAKYPLFAEPRRAIGTLIVSLHHRLVSRAGA